MSPTQAQSTTPAARRMEPFPIQSNIMLHPIQYPLRKSEWQLQREREARDLFRAKCLILIALNVIAGAIYWLSRNDDFMAVWREIWK